MKFILIAAHDPNLVIGKDGRLPWHLPEDLKFFKRTTMGMPLLMGRVVFEEIGEKPLPGRDCIVLSRSKTYSGIQDVHCFDTSEKALDYLKQSGTEKVFIIGGAFVYREWIHKADEMIITEVHQPYEGDTFFPEYRNQVGVVWRELKREDHESFSFVFYERIRNTDPEL